MRDHYAVLGVEPTASASQVRRAYREAVRRTHPDAGGRAEDFRAAREAWRVLGNPARRTAYDEWLLLSRDPGVVADEPWQRPSVGVFPTRSTVLGPVALTGTMLVLVLWTLQPLAALVGLVVVVGAGLRLLRGRSVALWLALAGCGVVGLVSLAVLLAASDRSPALPALAAMSLAVFSAAVGAAAYVRGGRGE